MDDDGLSTACFDVAEADILREVMERLQDRHDDRLFVRGVLERLVRLAQAVKGFPSLYAPEKLAGHYRGPETLVEQLARRGSFATPLGLPVKASLAHDFVLAKVQAFRAILIVLEVPETQVSPALRERLRLKIGQSIYTLLADQLLMDIVVDGDVGLDRKRRAAELLVRFWERCIDLEIDDFCPLLESAWRARNRLVVEFGTLIGSVEVMRLLASAADPDIVDAFLRDDMSEGQRQAFEEFLFGISFEQLETLRREMNREGLVVIDRSWVARTLGLPKEELFSGVADPEAMFISYQKRQLGASYRRLRDVPGPRRTAEAFLMLSILAGR